MERNIRALAEGGTSAEIDVRSRRRHPALVERDPLGIEPIHEVAVDRQVPERRARVEGTLFRRQRRPFRGCRERQLARHHALALGRSHGDLTVATLLRPAAKRPRQEVSARRVAGEAQTLDLEKVSQPRQIDVLVLDLPRRDGRHAFAERRHAVIELGVAAVQLAPGIGHLEAIAHPVDVARQVRKAPVVHAGDRAGELSLQLAPAGEHPERARGSWPGRWPEPIAMEKDVLLCRKVDLRHHVVGLLRKLREIDHAIQHRSRALGDEIDPIEPDLAAVEREPRLHVGAKGLVRFDPDRSLRERRGAAIVVRREAPVERDVQVARHRRPRRGMVVVGKLSAACRDASQRGREPARTAVLSIAHEVLGKVWRLFGYDSTSIRQSVMSTDSIVSLRVNAVHHGTRTRDHLRRQERAVLRRQSLDHQVLDDEHARKEPGRQPADAHRPLHVPSTLLAPRGRAVPAPDRRSAPTRARRSRPPAARRPRAPRFAGHGGAVAPALAAVAPRRVVVLQP